MFLDGGKARLAGHQVASSCLDDVLDDWLAGDVAEEHDVQTETRTAERAQLLTAGQVAKRLQISKATISKLVANGELPAIQLCGPGSTIRIDAGELGRWLFGASGRNTE